MCGSNSLHAIKLKGSLTHMTTHIATHEARTPHPVTLFVSLYVSVCAFPLPIQLLTVENQFEIFSRQCPRKCAIK